MGLIESTRHTAQDLVVWSRLSGYDRRIGDSKDLRKRTTSAMDDVARFLSHAAYVGVSWGKDSVVVAHMARQIDSRIPLVWVRVEPIANPDCVLVRDRFLERYPGEYLEIEEWCAKDRDGWHATGTLERGFAKAARAIGSERYLSGIRGEESGIRKLRGKLHGVATKNTCAPLIWWRHEHVFAYLARHALPIHPAYACSMDGALPRDRLRVASLGGQRGTGMGRTEWESRYYPEVMCRI